MSTTYTIQITEAQRAILLAAVAQLAGDAEAQHDLTPEDEPRVLRDLLFTLPDDEAEMVVVYGCRPGEAVHGFAL